MPSRSKFDLSHFCFQAGKIGRLQTLSVIPTLPGDSISININGNTRLAGLRRSLITDAAMDLFAFYIPHRHVYPGRGQDNLWLKLIREGITSDVTLPTTTLNKTYQCLGQRELSGVVPKWRADPYDRIYNRYFKHPTDEDFSLLVPVRILVLNLLRNLLHRALCLTPIGLVLLVVMISWSGLLVLILLDLRVKATIILILVVLVLLICGSLPSSTPFLIICLNVISLVLVIGILFSLFMVAISIMT